MGLEVADYISELVPGNPTTADPISQGDDHIRQLKQVLQNALPGNTAPLTFTGDMTVTGNITSTITIFAVNIQATNQILGATGSFTGDVGMENLFCSANVNAVNGIYNGDIAALNGAFTGVLQGNTVRDAAGNSLDGLASQVADAYGNITNSTVFDGVGIASVGEESTGQFLVNFTNAASATSKQLVIVNADPEGFRPNNIAAACTYLSPTQARIYIDQIGPTSVTPINAYPISLLRMLLP